MAYESFAKIKRKHLVKEQVPAFVANEHATFLSFLEAYYEFLSEKQFVTSERFVDYLDVDNVPEDFLNNFWEEIREIPGTVLTDKRLLAKHIRDLYASKGTRKSYDLLFRILFNESVTIYEPKEDMLRSSDGKWDNIDIIRTKVPLGFDLSSLNGRKLYQYNDFQIELCQFIVADVSVVNTDHEYLYIEITPSTLRGRVFSNRLLYNKDRSIYLEIVQTFAISGYPYRGSNYKNGDIFFTGIIPCYVETVGSGEVDDIFVIDPGTGYSVGDYLQVDYSDSGGVGLSVMITSVGPNGEVTGYRVVNKGKGFENLPKIVGNGTGKFYPYSSSIGRVLSVSVKDASSDNDPINLTTRAIVSSSLGLIEGERLIRQSYTIRNENGLGFMTEDGSYFLNESQDTQEVIGTIVAIEDSNTITIGDNFGTGELLSETDQRFITEDGFGFATEESTISLDSYTIRGELSGVTCSILHVNPAKINSRLEPIYRISSRYRNEDGFVSQLNKKIQDSLFYQDFSYVIKSSQSFENYKNILYKMIHPAGMSVFGQVNLDTYVLTVENRIKKAFNELRLMSESVLKLNIKSDSDFAIQIESKGCVGTSYDFLEKYKFILGNDHVAGTFGASGLVGTHEFRRDLVTGYPQNWKIEDFGHIKFTDLYTYSAGYGEESPLVLNGSWQLNGVQELDGKFNSTVENTLGKYKLNTNKRLTWALGAEVTITPSFPIEDVVTVSDSVSYSMNAKLTETIATSDSQSRVMSFVYSVDETTVATDNISSLYTFIKQIDETSTVSDGVSTNFSSVNSLLSSVTIADQVTNIGTDAPKDNATATDIVDWVLATTTGINETTLNSGPL